MRCTWSKQDTRLGRSGLPVKGAFRQVSQVAHKLHKIPWQHMAAHKCIMIAMSECIECNMCNICSQIGTSCDQRYQLTHGALRHGLPSRSERHLALNVLAPPAATKQESSVICEENMFQYFEIFAQTHTKNCFNLM